MSIGDQARSAARARRTLDAPGERLRLSRAGLAALAAGLIALVVTAAGFADVSEDVTGHDGITAVDAHDLSIFTTHRTALLIRVARAVTNLGAIGVLSVIAVLAAYLLWRRGARLGLAVVPALSLALAGAAAAIGKTLVGRPRPPIGLRLLKETEPSFPSGHTTDATALYLALALVLAIVMFRKPLLRVLAVAGAGLLAALVGLSRLELGVHWPTDVMAGWTLGATVALAVTITAAVTTHLAVSAADSETAPVRRFLAAQRSSSS